jgi:hypothetical protein
MHDPAAEEHIRNKVQMVLADEANFGLLSTLWSRVHKQEYGAIPLMC